MRFFRRSRSLFTTNGLGAEMWPPGTIWTDREGVNYLITKHRTGGFTGIRVYGRPLSRRELGKMLRMSDERSDD
jgi:hypothetical protein